jgi:hypothetical protein
MTLFGRIQTKLRGMLAAAARGCLSDPTLRRQVERELLVREVLWRFL